MRSISFRNLSALLAFLAATLLLFIRFEPRHTQLSSNVENGTSNSTGIAVPVGHAVHNFSPFFPSHNHAHTDFKRAVSQDFQCLVEKGQQYWEQGVLPAFDGQSRFPSPNFGAAEDVLQDSGWSMTDDMKALPKYWNDAFKATKFKVPKSGVREIQLDQNQDFENDYGEQKATSGRYHGFFVPENNFIIMFLTWSPRFRVSMRRISPGNTPIPPEDIPKYLPRMSQLSDLVWHTWDLVKNHQDLGSLRYYAVEGITNGVTKPLMLEIFKARRGTTDVPWKNRITFDLRSEEGKALLASPNGIAVAWLLIHRAAVLGRREVRVTVFNSKRTNNLGDYLCMVWELVPVGEMGTFGKEEKGA